MKSRFVPLATLSFALALLVAPSAPGLPGLVGDAAAQPVISSQDRCRADLAIGGRRYFEAVLLARLRCTNRIITGELPPGTDCATGHNDPKLNKRLRKAEDRLSNIGQSCGGVNLLLLGFPGACQDTTGDPFDTNDYKQCVVDHTDELVPVLLDYYYPPITDFFRNSYAKCLKGSAMDGATSLRRSWRARERCLLGQEFNTVDDEVKCREEILPYGPGTGDEKVDRDISRAYIKLLGAIPQACVNVQIDDFDYQSTCPDPTGGIFTIFDLKNCFFNLNRDKVLDALAIPFPTDPVCGDGNVQTGEECDEGLAGNSDTQPDSCRTNCQNPECGDGVDDTPDECDDGNSVDTDCCSNLCQLPDCGDGVKQCNEQCDNGSSNSNTNPDSCRLDCKNFRCGDGTTDSAEECDDNNLTDEDGCSALCFDEFCGDDIVQEGLEEECDTGVDRSDTEPDACRLDCQDPECGDGVTDTGEECDDGNKSEDDLCNNLCEDIIPTVCGDGQITGGEECEDDDDCDGSDVCGAPDAGEDKCKCLAVCPAVGELTLYAGSGRDCVTNTDCDVGTCEDNVCRTLTRLDSGWVGLAHDADINDKIRTRGFLDCPNGDGGPTCGQCNVIGVDPSLRSCRCANNVRDVCSEPFKEDSPECPACVGGASKNNLPCASNTDCRDTSQVCSLTPKVCANNPTQICRFNPDCPGSTCAPSTTGQKVCSGTQTQFCTSNTDCQFQGTCTGAADCNCYFGAPFPLASGGTPACIVNRFAQNLTGTANVDLGQGEINARLRTVVYLGATVQEPCPTCGGTCSNSPSTFCDRNADCTGGTCNMDPILDDGVRGGVCSAGAAVGLSCDATAYNASFPTKRDGDSGGYYSLDCLPETGANVSGEGLSIILTQTTGTSKIESNLECDPENPGTLCPCLQCTGDPLVPCDANSDCFGQLGSCSAGPSIFCEDNSDCGPSVSLGNCIAQSNTVARCSLQFSKQCMSNSDCVGSAGTCNVSTCSGIGSQGVRPQQNDCEEGLCDDPDGDGLGLCTLGPDATYCDGFVKANGIGIFGCSSNLDCSVEGIGFDAGTCSVVERRSCFGPTITAIGDPDPQAPLGVATFCIPSTDNNSINKVAGLPGPGRIQNQALSKTFCGLSDKQYIPGVGGCLD